MNCPKAYLLTYETFNQYMHTFKTRAQYYTHAYTHARACDPAFVCMRIRACLLLRDLQQTHCFIPLLSLSCLPALMCLAFEEARNGVRVVGPPVADTMVQAAQPC